MRPFVLFTIPLLIALVVLVAAAPPDRSTSSDASPKKYVCPPCGMTCDTKVYDQPGRCPDCGARLVEQGATRASAPAPKKKAAILIFDGVQIIDYTGPYEVLGQGGFDVFTVAESKATLTTSMGMKVVPEFTFADAPKADVLVVPGGAVDKAQASVATLKWVREESAASQHTMSVCNGAFILASAGLLDGLTATTFYGLIDTLKRQAPKTRIVSDQRFVDNGKVITTAGLSSGIDGALHLIDVMLGHGRAQAVALHLEYDWHPDSHFARASLADRLIPDLDLDIIGTWSTVRTEGTTDRWDFVMRGDSDLSPAELLNRIGQGLTKEGNWTGVARDGGAASRSDWKFKGPDGRAWNGTLSVEPVPGQTGQYSVSLNIARVG